MARKLKPLARRAIIKRRKEIRAKRRALAAQYRADVHKLDMEEGELKKRCTHPGMAFHVDPAGGHDSYFYCGICGLDSKQRPEGSECGSTTPSR